MILKILEIGTKKDFWNIRLIPNRHENRCTGAGNKGLEELIYFQIKSSCR